MDNNTEPSDTDQPDAPSACEAPRIAQWRMQGEVLNTTSEQSVESSLPSAAAVVEDCTAISLSAAELLEPADHAGENACAVVEVEGDSPEPEADNAPAGLSQQQLEAIEAPANTLERVGDAESAMFEYSPAVEQEEEIAQNFQDVLDLYAIDDGARPSDGLLDDDSVANARATSLTQTPELPAAAEIESPRMVVVSPVWVTPEHRHLLADSRSFEVGIVVANEDGSHVSEPCTNFDSLSALQAAVAADVSPAAGAHSAAQLTDLNDSSEEEEEELELGREADDQTNERPLQSVGCDEEEACVSPNEEPESDAGAHDCPDPAAECTTREEEEATEQSESPCKQVETATEVTMLLATPHREHDSAVGEASTPPKQSPAEKATASLPTIQQSEEEYALELEAIQRKAEEQLRTYVQRQLQQKKQDFERKTQAAAVKLAAEWKQDGLTIDEIIDLNFKAYAEQYEDLYTKALALKRTFEQSKVEFEHQVMCKYRDLQQPRNTGWGNEAYAPQRIAFEESEEQDPLDRPFSMEFPAQAESASGQLRKKQARPFAGEIPPELKRAAIRKRFKVPAASTN